MNDQPNPTADHIERWLREQRRPWQPVYSGKAWPSATRHRTLLDGPDKPSSIKLSLWLNPDGRIWEIEFDPVFKTKAER